MRLAIALFFFAPRAAHAWTSEGAVWPTYRLPLEFAVGPSCRDFDDAETPALVQRVFQRWEDIDCAHISFEYIGRGADLGLGNGGFGYLGDDVNNVSWCTSCLGGGALGVASLSGSRGIMDECDEYMEDGYEWTLDHDLAAAGWAIDAEAVTAQESGHCLGLGHTDVARATMYPTYHPAWEMWTPDPDDIDGLCSLYPLNEGCEDDADCRDETSCVDRVCLPIPPPPRDHGWPCLDASECLSGVCVLDPATDENICSEECDLAAPGCPEGSFCRRFGPCAEAFCVSQAAGSRAPGEGCAIDVDCASGLCDAGTCALPCDPELFEGACPDGSACWETADACGACRPGPPPAPFGQPCRGSDDCPGRVCANVGDDNFCTEQCADDAECPEGFYCGDVQGVGLCVPQGGFLGDPCEQNLECGSNLCAHIGDDAYCTRYCDDFACPDAWECRDASGYLICLRPEPEGGCGCAAAGAPGAGLALFGIAVAAAVRRRR